MSIVRLKEVLPPPVEACENSGQWSQVEERIGISLPADYKEYIRTFGTGCVGGFLWIFNPFADNVRLNLSMQLDGIFKTEENLKRNYGSMFPLPLFPTSGGLLPVGLTDNGDYVSFMTEGPAESWPIIVTDSREPEWERFNLQLTDFLTAILTRERTCGIFPRAFPPPNPRFRVFSGS